MEELEGHKIGHFFGGRHKPMTPCYAQLTILEKIFCNIITNPIINRRRESRMVSLRTKNKKRRGLIELQQLPQHSKVLVLNLTNQSSQLKLGLEYSFISKNKNQ